MPLSQEELEDFERNNIHPDSVASKEHYKKYRGRGMTHKEALKKTIDDIDSLTSNSMEPETLRKLKRALLTQPGMFFE